MTRYVAGRLAQMVPVLILASIAIWAMIYMVPGDPVLRSLGPDATPLQLEAARRELGLDRPVWVQYVSWLSSAITGDLGVSFVNGFPVWDLIFRRLPATLHLVVGASVVAVVLAVPVGMAGVASDSRVVRKAVSAYISLSLAVPSFLIGVLLILVIGVHLRALPTHGYVPIWEDFGESLRHLIMPVLTMALFFSGLLTRFLKASLSAERQQDYVRTARAKGVPRPQIWRRHIRRNALLPVVTVFGLYAGTLIGGAVITESIFAYPGIGRLILDSVARRDYPVVQGVVLLVVVSFVIINLIVDVLYAGLDPRIRYGKER